MMTRSIISFILLTACFTAGAQSKLTVEKIMRDPKWMGTSPSNLQWSNDGQSLYFNWNPGQAPNDSLYFITLNNKTPQKASPQVWRAGRRQTDGRPRSGR